MSTDLVHFLTVIGDAASGVEAACSELLSRRFERDVDGYGSDDWSERDHRDLADLWITLIGAARNLPVLYDSQFLDGWSQGGLGTGLLGWPDRKRRLICGDGFDLTFYSASHIEVFVSQLRSRRRTKLYRTSSETRRYLDRLKEALEEPLWLKCPFVVVVIHQCLGATRHDADVEAALSTPLASTNPEDDDGGASEPALHDVRAVPCRRQISFGM